MEILPLNGVIGFSDLMMNTKLDKTQALYMNTIFKSANLLLTLIHDILDFSKIEAGKLELNVERVDLPLLINQSVDVVKLAIQNKSIGIRITIPQNMHQFVWID